MECRQVCFIVVENWATWRFEQAACCHKPTGKSSSPKEPKEGKKAAKLFA